MGADRGQLFTFAGNDLGPVKRQFGNRRDLRRILGGYDFPRGGVDQEEGKCKSGC